ncbi:uncharacterized protein RDI95_004737 isoform 1-T11 [Morus bassanus]
MMNQVGSGHQRCCTRLEGVVLHGDERSEKVLCWLPLELDKYEALQAITTVVSDSGIVVEYVRGTLWCVRCLVESVSRCSMDTPPAQVCLLVIKHSEGNGPSLCLEAPGSVSRGCPAGVAVRGVWWGESRAHRDLGVFIALGSLSQPGNRWGTCLSRA